MASSGTVMTYAAHSLARRIPRAPLQAALCRNARTYMALPACAWRSLRRTRRLSFSCLLRGYLNANSIATARLLHTGPDGGFQVSESNTSSREATLANGAQAVIRAHVGEWPGEPDSLAMLGSDPLELQLEAWALGHERAYKHALSRLKAHGHVTRCETLEENLASMESLPLDEVMIDPIDVWTMLRKNPGETLPGVLVRRVLERSIAMFRERQDVVVDVELPELPMSSVLMDNDGRVVVVGDTHGQLADVLWIFHENGPPSPSTTYVFNGDIADRGHHAVEIFVLALAFKLQYPDYVHVLRGNHEHAAMNERSWKAGGGFAQECIGKHGPTVYKDFQALFRLLPLFAVLENQIFIVHAGLPRCPHVDVASMRQMALPSHYPASRSKQEILKGIPLPWTRDETIVFDAQWGDPHDGDGILPSKRGHDAVMFGKDVTERFLDRNGFKLCLRSHEVPLRYDPARNRPGFRWAHKGLLLTVFSASNYAGSLKNNGAVAIFHNRYSFDIPDGCRLIGDLAVEIREHYIPSLHDLNTKLSADVSAHATILDKVIRAPTSSEQTMSVGDLASSDLDSPAKESNRLVNVSGHLPEEVMSYVLGVMYLRREDLWSFCQQHADEGLLPFRKLVSELTRLCDAGVEFPWESIFREGFGISLSVSGEVSLEDLHEILCRYRVEWSGKGRTNLDDSREHLRKAIERFVFADLSLSEAIQLFDRDLDGIVTQHECTTILRRVLPDLSDRQAHRVFAKLRSGWGGQRVVSSERFLASLILEFSSRDTSPNPFLQQALLVIARALCSSATDDKYLECPVTAGEMLLHQFRELDSDGDGFVTRGDFFEVLTSLGILAELGFDATHEDILFRYLDVTQSGRINALAFLQGFSVALPGTRARIASSHLADDFLPGFGALLLCYRPVVLRACRAIDLEGEGLLPIDNFSLVVREVLYALNTQGQHFEGQIQELRDVLDSTVDYDDILGGLSFVDTSYQDCCRLQL